MRLGYILLLAFVAIGAATAARTKKKVIHLNDTRIVGGNRVDRMIPYQVSIQKQHYGGGRPQHFCGGSIIRGDIVLTAAHCVDGERPELISVVAGTVRISQGGTRHRAVWLKKHPNYRKQGTIVNDIAVIKVSPPFPLNGRTVSTIDYSDETTIPGNYPVTLTGWGSTTPNPSGQQTDHLQILNYFTQSNEDCRRRGYKVTNTEVCAAAGRGKGACVGDSGGPLVNRDRTKQIGVVSYGSATCAQGYPDVYARVSMFKRWIDQAIKVKFM